MDVTVRDLSRSRRRHFWWGVIFLVLTGLLVRTVSRLDTDRRAAHRAAAATTSLRVSTSDHRTSLTLDVYDVAVWTTLASSLAALYHLWQWRRKSRRFGSQRRRAANELLRADFRNTGRP